MRTKFYARLLITATVAFVCHVVSYTSRLYGEETKDSFKTTSGLVSVVPFDIPEKGLISEERETLDVFTSVLDLLSTRSNSKEILRATKGIPQKLWPDQANAETAFHSLLLDSRPTWSPSQIDYEIALVCECGALRFNLIQQEKERTPEELRSPNPLNVKFIVTKMTLLTVDSRETFVIVFDVSGKMRSVAYGETKSPFEKYDQRRFPLPPPYTGSYSITAMSMTNFNRALFYKTRHSSEWNEKGELVSETFPKEPVKMLDVHNHAELFLKTLENIQKGSEEIKDKVQPTE